MEFDIEALKMFCRIKDIEHESISDKSIRKNVWAYLEEEMDEEEDEVEMCAGLGSLSVVDPFAFDE